MQNFVETIYHTHPLETEATEAMLRLLKPKTVDKGKHLLRADQLCQRFYFIASGLMKLAFKNENRTFIMTFFKENTFFTELSSFNADRPSKYALVALEPTELLYIDKADIMTLCRTYESVNTLFRKLNEVATIRMMDRISEMLEDDAKKRYESFLRLNAHLLSRISLGDLADYIGVTQVSLSRIRSQI